MDLYNLISKIPYSLMVLLGIAIVAQLYFGGLLSLDAEIDDSQGPEYTRALVLENLLSVEATRSELGNTDGAYDYSRRRAVIPVEFFTNQNPSSGQVGYHKNGNHCYIERASGLDGEDFGFYITPLDDVSKHASSPRSLDCTTERGDRSKTIFSPAMVIRKANGNPRLPVRLYVYEIG